MIAPLKVANGLNGTMARLRAAMPYVLVALAHAAGSRLGLLFTFEHLNVSPIWPPAGIAVAALLALGVRVWPAIFLSGLIFNAIDLPLTQAVPLAVGGTVGPLIAVVLLRGLADFRPALDRVRDVGALAVAAMLSSLVSSTIGSLTFVATGRIAAGAAPAMWGTWAFGDAMGILTVAPAVLVWSNASRVAPPRRHLLELVLLMLAVIGASLLVFQGLVGELEFRYPLAYVLIPLVVWAAARFEHRGATAATLLVAAIAMWHTANGMGPFARQTAEDSLLLVQVFTAVVALTALSVSAMMIERRQAEEELRLLHDISHAITESADYQAALRVALERVCAATGWEYGEVWVSDAEGTQLSRLPAWHGDQRDFAVFAEASGRYSFGRGEGLPGRAWSAKAPVWVSDVTTDERFVRRDDALASGIRAGVAIPVLAGNEVVAVLSFFMRRPRARDEWFLELVVVVASQIGSAVERKRMEGERRRFETQVQQTQKLESLGVLAGGIAHDFNNLLAVMVGNAGLARLELPVDSAVQETLRRIELAGLRATELTRQMLAYAGKGQLVVGRLDLSALVEEMVRLLESAISKKVTLRFALAEGLPAIEGDATQLRQVVMNLITNASEAHGSASGTIVVRTGAIRASRSYLASCYVDDELPEGDYVFLEVSDTGGGMDAATQARIFDPFFTTKFTGRGLGLAAALGIVRRHRGAVRIRSSAGSGTTFTILLPGAALPADAPRPDAETDTRGWRASGTVLVVDDEEAVRTTAERILQSVGFSVRSAPDGRAALETFAARQNEIILVLLDLTMPRMGGEEALRELRRLKPDVRVVLSSGYGEPSTQLGPDAATAFLRKPYSPGELVSTVRAVLERSRAASLVN